MARALSVFLLLVVFGCAPALGPVPALAPAPVPALAPSPPRFPIDSARMKRDVETLAAFGTRHTLSDTKSPTRGIGAARLWILAELQRAAAGTAMHASLEPHTQPADGKRVPADTDIEDVVA